MRKPEDEVSNALRVHLQSAIRTRLERQVQDLVHRRDLLVRRRMQHNNDTANQTDGAANLAQQSQLFVQKVATKHSTNEHTQRAERSNQNCRRKGIGGEVEDLAEDHGDDTGPPCRVAQVRVTVAVEAVLLHGRVEALLCDDETGADGQGGRDCKAEADISGGRVSNCSAGVVWRAAAAYLSSTMMALSDYGLVGRAQMWGRCASATDAPERVAARVARGGGDAVR